MENVNFKSPVPNGSLLQLNSSVYYTENNLMVIHVTAKAIDPLQGKEDITTSFFFTFQTEPKEGDLERQVIFETFEESMQYLEGKRIANKKK